jgi:hypothetical protein
MKVIVSRFLLICVCAAAAALPTFAQDPTPEPTAPTGPAGAQRPGGPSQDPQPYDRVITKDAKTKKGVFSVHQVKDKFFYEIPKSEMGKDFLWVSQIQRTTNGVGYGGQALGSRMVRWELGENNRVFLKLINYSVVWLIRTSRFLRLFAMLITRPSSWRFRWLHGGLIMTRPSSM